MKKYSINSDISRAETLPASFYTDELEYLSIIETIFTTSWLYLGDTINWEKQPENCFPVTLLDKSLSEELLVVKHNENWQVMSNICTHRGFKLIHHPMLTKKIHCGYHGRRFGMDGKMEHMPEFSEAKNFPRPCDHLPHIDFFIWKRFMFGGLSSKISPNQICDCLNERLGFLDMEQWDHAPEYSKSYGIKANWALYIDNYLEGFHIPFVHHDLGKIVDYGSYETIIHNHVVLQIGYSKSSEFAFDLPKGHPDHGQNVSAYYYWIYPNFMLNIYTWGVQINIVKPISIDYCKVDFEYFIADKEKWELFGKDSIAEKTEREDEYVVEAVQKGMKSRLYNNGRFSPVREKGVHYFHSLIANYMSENEGS